jgi:formate hydrogenlyase transcriptional activator
MARTGELDPDRSKGTSEFEGIVGASSGLKNVLESARMVASTNSSVLLLGESGTGKELVARAIHRMSARKNQSFVTVNCAALPTELLESELFGYEKGAFTGADRQKAGRFETADKGTIFLDEIGDAALEIQPKLLRVLQEHEFERVGGTRTIAVDIRVIAATSLDLRKQVERGEFRSDLFFRLNVFPLHLPPLRHRRRDIPLLVLHFVNQYSRKLGKQIETVPDTTMDALMSWEWPGNVRELENLIERSVILSTTSTLNVPLEELEAAKDPGTAPDTLSDVRRSHIIRALREARGKIGGPDGAAERLGLKRSTLQSKIERLGIKPEEYLR